jgi:hypothetical protein
MMSRLLRCVVLIALAAMLAGHVTELFDHWDHTLRTGKDADYTMVMVAACVGLAFAIAKRLPCLARSLRRIEGLPLPLSSLFCPVLVPEIASTGPSPPLIVSLRI